MNPVKFKNNMIAKSKISITWYLSLKVNIKIIKAIDQKSNMKRYQKTGWKGFPINIWYNNSLYLLLYFFPFILQIKTYFIQNRQGQMTYGIDILINLSLNFIIFLLENILYEK